MSKILRAYAIVMEDKLEAIRNKSLYLRILNLVLLLSILSSCAWLSSRRTLFGGSNEEEKQEEPQMVSKSQYDALLAKYEDLQNRMQNQGNSPAKTMSMGNLSEKDKALMNDLKGVPGVDSGSGVAETVDVFGGGQRIDKDMVDMSSAPENYLSEISEGDFGQVEKEVMDLKKGEQMMMANQFNDAMAIFNVLRQSSIRQIRVRAQFNIGEILFAQNEFDLAMQAFEDIIQKQAFSGVVLKTLGRLIACASKLNLKEKQDQYYSILHDFFESA